MKRNKIALIDHGIGNIGSIRRALEEAAAEVSIVNQPALLGKVDKLVLPGTGAFAEGISALEETGWLSELYEKVVVQQIPCLCICLGMHLLATSGEEGGNTTGLDIISGNVKLIPIAHPSLRLPHMGWNTVQRKSDSRILKNIPEVFDAYFAHSYYFADVNPEAVVAESTYGLSFPSVLEKNNCFATQFHPEKSGKVGLRMLANFVEI